MVRRRVYLTRVTNPRHRETGVDIQRTRPDQCKRRHQCKRDRDGRCLGVPGVDGSGPRSPSVIPTVTTTESSVDRAPGKSSLPTTHRWEDDDTHMKCVRTRCVSVCVCPLCVHGVSRVYTIACKCALVWVCTRVYVCVRCRVCECECVCGHVCVCVWTTSQTLSRLRQEGLLTVTGRE